MNSLSVKLATLWGLGRSPVAPGTLGAAAGTLFYGIILHHLRTTPAAFCLLVLNLLAVVICDLAEKEIGSKDPSCVILDEFAAMPICFLGIETIAKPQLPFWSILIIGFLLFRFFDILKPLGIKSLQHLSGGLGIVIDDIVAAIYSNICLSIAVIVLNFII